jgi:hypothetical protein
MAARPSVSFTSDAARTSESTTVMESTVSSTTRKDVSEKANMSIQPASERINVSKATHEEATTKSAKQVDLNEQTQPTVSFVPEMSKMQETQQIIVQEDSSSAHGDTHETADVEEVTHVQSPDSSSDLLYEDVLERKTKRKKKKKKQIIKSETTKEEKVVRFDEAQLESLQKGTGADAPIAVEAQYVQEDTGQETVDAERPTSYKSAQIHDETALTLETAVVQAEETSLETEESAAEETKSKPTSTKYEKAPHTPSSGPPQIQLETPPKQKDKVKPTVTEKVSTILHALPSACVNYMSTLAWPNSPAASNAACEYKNVYFNA